MNTDKPNAACTATTDFGLRREAKRHAAFGCNRRTESGVAATLQSSLRFASASCHRSPNLCRPCAKLQDWITDIYSTLNTQLSTLSPHHIADEEIPILLSQNRPGLHYRMTI
jgi:hypothetical protein